MVIAFWTRSFGVHRREITSIGVAPSLCLVQSLEVCNLVLPYMGPREGKRAASRNRPCQYRLHMTRTCNARSPYDQRCEAWKQSSSPVYKLAEALASDRFYSYRSAMMYSCPEPRPKGGPPRRTEPAMATTSRNELRSDRNLFPASTMNTPTLISFPPFLFPLQLLPQLLILRLAFF